MRVVTLVPWRDGPDDRRRLLWDWTRPFLEDLGYPIFVAPGPERPAPFNRSAAVNEAARLAGDWDAALIGDSDTVQQAGPEREAAQLAVDGLGLVYPWTHRIKLSPSGTDQIARRGPGWVSEAHRDRTDRTSPTGGGGTMVVSREAFEAVGGMDERFAGYGNEDLAFRVAIETLFIGNGAERVAGMIWHLHHRPARFVGTDAAATPGNQRLWARYKTAQWHPDAMRALLTGRGE